MTNETYYILVNLVMIANIAYVLYCMLMYCACVVLSHLNKTGLSSYTKLNLVLLQSEKGLKCICTCTYMHAYL